MKSRSQNWKFSVVTLIVAVILGALLIGVSPTPQRAQPRQLKSAINELNELFVVGVSNPAVRKGADSVTKSTRNQFFADSVAPRQAGDSHSETVLRMQTSTAPDKTQT